jgi:peptide chain release factor 1
MYRAYCSSKGFRTSLVSCVEAEGTANGPGAQVALEEAILRVEEPGAYSQFRSEAGVHRVQRVPATETKGRTHTSAVSVLVLPSFPTNENSGDKKLQPDDSSSDYFVDPKDVRVETMRAGGAGGQHVNKTESAVRLTHIPTKTVVSIQEGRSQHQNKDLAWQLLRSRIAQMRREIREEEAMLARRDIIGKAKMGREDKVRTYNWGQQRVTDHRSGLTLRALDDVMDGGQSLHLIMESVRKWLLNEDLKNSIQNK